MATKLREKSGQANCGLGSTAKVVPAATGNQKYSETKDFKLALLGNVDSGMLLVLLISYISVIRRMLREARLGSLCS